MRAGPLSQTSVISRLNQFYVPVYVSDEDYAEKGIAPPEEKAELRRIFNEGYAAKKSVGTVHVYILGPDGHLIDSMHVAQAARTEQLLPLLDRVTAQLGVPAGRPLVKPVVQSSPPAAAPGDLVLHLTARGFNHGSWREFPSENWIVLPRDQWSRLLPPGPARVGTKWTIDPDLASRLLVYFYPQTENNDLASNRIDQESLTGVLTAQHGSLAEAHLSGTLRMKHSFYPNRDDDKFVQATLAGTMEFDMRRKQVRSVKLVTDTATYGQEGFGVAVASVRIPATGIRS